MKMSDRIRTKMTGGVLHTLVVMTWMIPKDDGDRIKGSKKQWGLLITRLKGEERSKECVHGVLVDLPPGRSSQP